MRTAKRIEKMPPYLFAGLDKKVADARARGIDVISFAVGDPDLPTPQHIVEAAIVGLKDPSTHRYPSYSGMPEFRQTIAAYYRRRFGVELDPDRQVLPLIGSKEGIYNLATAIVDPGDVCLIPDPAYPVYETSALLFGGEIRRVPLSEESGYLPDLESVDASRAKILWLNYPNNPTAAVCDLDVFEKSVAFCSSNDLLLAHDAAYIEVTYDDYVAPSVLQARGALETAIEFGSVSKTFNMTGWRVGWVVGAARAIEALGRVKTNIDSGIFNALQKAAIAALDGPTEPLREQIEVYRRRRNLVVEALNTAGWSMSLPKGAIYVWAPTPQGESSASFSEFLLEKAGIVVAPGAGYGPKGDGFFRISLTISDEDIEKGMERVVRAMKER